MGLYPDDGTKNDTITKFKTGSEYQSTSSHCASTVKCEYAKTKDK